MTPAQAEGAIRRFRLMLREGGKDVPTIIAGLYMGLLIAYRRPEYSDELRHVCERFMAEATGRTPEEIEHVVDVASWLDDEAVQPD